jgi:hypothetical protein
MRAQQNLMSQMREQIKRKGNIKSSMKNIINDGVMWSFIKNGEYNIHN